MNTTAPRSGGIFVLGAWFVMFEATFKTDRGFTLVEMLMVITLVAIMGTFATSQYVSFAEDARRTVTISRMNDLKLAIAGDARMMSSGQYTSPGFISEVGSVPTSLNDLIAQGAYPAYSPFSRRGWRGPYVSAAAEPNWNRDSWGTLFQYTAATRTIRSCGRDLVCGNADDITTTF